MRTYNERLTNVHTDHVGKPVRWTWRERTYQGGPVLDHWITTTEWWRQEQAAGAEAGGIEHWLIEASSAHGTGQVELALDEASKVWRLVSVVD
ncbi:MAG: hypothetical protein QOE54_4445 [Streptosporangiaceae bacterium]|jgi:hypothetical protein|nr:hypothetical protein [Streptosporangiaceae bacterium]MDX6432079.1 hypothetical protein [Streptosporangiaceae bacterium]